MSDGHRQRCVSLCEDDEVEGPNILTVVERDPAAADFLISIFMAALNSYRSTTLVKPFPKRFRRDPPPGVAEREGSDEFNDFDRLRACAAAIPPVDQIIKSNASENDGSRPSSAITPPLDEECSSLLRWVIQNRKFRVVTHATTMYDKIQASTGTSSYPIKPDLIMEIVHSEDTLPEPARRRFLNLEEEHGSMIAYHGTPLENLHSILRSGFLNHFNTTALFGPGTYLSSDLSVCMGFTRAGATWKKSGLGAKLSCVAVCQVIKHPAVKLPGGKTEHDLDRSSTVGGDRVPSTYIFVYLEESKSFEAGSTNATANGGGGVYGIIAKVGAALRKRAFALSMLFYIFILAMVALFQNRKFKRWYAKKFGNG
eukprot:gene13053-27902_t